MNRSSSARPRPIGPRPVLRALRLSAAGLPVSGLLVSGLLAAGLLGAGLVGCGEGAPEETRAAPRQDRAAPGAPVAGDSATEREIRDLITATSPLPPTSTKVAEAEWYGRRRDMLERLRAAGPEVGRGALDTYRERTDLPLVVRMALLDVAAHAAPAEATDHLVHLIQTYGEPIELRNEACSLIGTTAPEQALTILEPVILQTRRNKTYPPTETMLEGWIAAKESLDQDPVDFLTTVAADIEVDQATRHLAVETLGRYPDPIGRQTLETLLVESLGNNYIRRKACQALRDTVPPSDLCPLLEQVFSREADINFQHFLLSMIEAQCR